MPMSDGERGAVLTKIATVLQEQVHGQFLDFYAAAVSVTERQPDQVNNEIKNALTHLSRALVADTLVVAEREIDKACGHIDRAQRDAIKLAVFELRDRIQSACAEIRLVHGAIGTPFMVRREALTEKRKAIVRQEAEGASDVMSGFVELFIDAQELERDLINSFNIKYERIPRHKAWLIWSRRQVSGIATGLAIGVAGSVIFAVLVPDATGFGKSVRRAIGLDRPSVAEGTSEPTKPTTEALTTQADAKRQSRF